MAFHFDHWELEDGFNSCKVIKHTQSVKRKSVNYSNSCAVILIPSRSEYVEAGIDLWYNRSDQASAQSQVASEVKRLMDFNPSLTSEQAMSFLYQPRLEYINSFSQSCFERKENLNIMMIEKDFKSFEDCSSSLIRILNNYDRWDTNCIYADSTEIAISHVSNPTGSVSKIDVILIDVNSDDDYSYLPLVRMLKNVYCDQIIVGLVFNSEIDITECKRLRAINSGVNFLWYKPITNHLEMLPLLLVSRNKKPEKSRRISTVDPYLNLMNPN